VTFTVSGQGVLIGGATIGANPVRAEAGIATGIIRTTRIAGAVTVSATAPALKGATLEFESKADIKRTFA